MASSLQDASGRGSRPRTKTRLKGVAPGTAASPAQAPKTIGRYEVLEMLGRGAMGVVYKARDPLLDRVVAVKTINAPASLGERVRRAFLERFEREAKSAARISHPGVVTIFDVGLELESPFLVMEYLPGETLADRLDRERMPLLAAYECARELASALGCAHKLRIVHRDVKPANVLHAGDFRWKLADFGIARMPDSDLTQLGTFMGTPGYSPPEAIREGRYTAQADVFAWGALFYELLCGTIPYEGPDTETTNRKVLAAEPPSPRQHDSQIPEPLAEVALRALAHDPTRRYTDGHAVAHALVDAWHMSVSSGAIPMSAFTHQAAPVQVVGPLPPPKKSAPKADSTDEEKTLVDVRKPPQLFAGATSTPGEPGAQTPPAPREARAANPTSREGPADLRHHRTSVWVYLVAFLALALAATVLVVMLLGKKG